MGNDDCKTNIAVLEEQAQGRYELIHNKRVSLTPDVDLVGYSSVPITPFGIKDWEKFDLTVVPDSLARQYQKRKKSNYNFDGWRSSEEGWLPFRFTTQMEGEDSIQQDLESATFTTDPQKTIYVMHSPPNDTALDMLHNRKHVGSFAERLFIERYQPYLTLHGHIHETVDISGRFVEQIGRTLSFSSGNHNVGAEVAVVLFDLADLAGARRLIL